MFYKKITHLTLFIVATYSPIAIAMERAALTVYNPAAHSCRLQAMTSPVLINPTFYHARTNNDLYPSQEFRQGKLFAYPAPVTRNLNPHLYEKQFMFIRNKNLDILRTDYKPEVMESYCKRIFAEFICEKYYLESARQQYIIPNFQTVTNNNFKLAISPDGFSHYPLPGNYSVCIPFYEEIFIDTLKRNLTLAHEKKIHPDIIEKYHERLLAELERQTYQLLAIKQYNL